MTWLEIVFMFQKFFLPFERLIYVHCKQDDDYFEDVLKCKMIYLGQIFPSVYRLRWSVILVKFLMS